MTSFKRTFSKSTESECLLRPSESHHPSSPSLVSQVDQSKPLNPNDSEEDNYVPASHDDHGDDAGDVVGSNPRFVRSFKRRIRTRELRGWRYKSLSGTIESIQPELRGKSPVEGSNTSERNAKESLKNKEEAPSVRTWWPRIPSGMEGSDNRSRCSSISNDVFWLPETTIPSRQFSPETHEGVPNTDNRTPDNEREQAGNLEGKYSMSMNSTKEAMDTSVDVDTSKMRDCGGGFSFLSRLSKSVSLKRKQVKSHTKTRPLHFNDTVDDKESAVKENLKCIPENLQENTKVCDQIQQAVMLRQVQERMKHGDAEDKVPGTVEVNVSQSFSPNSQWFLSTSPTEAETSSGGSAILQQHKSTLPSESSNFSPIFIKPPPSSKTRNPSCVLVANESPIPEDGTCNEESVSASVHYSHPLQFQSSNSVLDNSWCPFSSTATEAGHSSDLTAYNPSTSFKELVFQSRACFLPIEKLYPTIMLRSELEAHFPGNERQASEDRGGTQEPQPRHDTQDPPQPVEYFNIRHTKLSDDLEKENVLKKSKFLSGTVYQTENNAKKFEADKGAAKNGTCRQERHPSGERRVTEVKASVTPTRIRRVGAIKKCDDVHHLLDDCRVSLTSILAVSHHHTNDLSKTPNFNTSSGAIPKSSQVSVAPQATSRDEARAKRDTEIPTKHEYNTTDTRCPEVLETRKESGKSCKKRERRSMKRSTSVPFWTKLHSLDGSSTTDSDCLAYSKLLTNEDKLATKNTEGAQATSWAASRVHYKEKVTHKRARSQDMSKTFKDEIFAVAPERSASHDNITKLKKEKALKLSCPAVEFPSSSPTSEAFPCSRSSPVTHCASCSDILGQEGRESPKLTRAFRDSKVKSVSAFCLSNTTAKKSSEGQGQGGDPSPAGDAHAGDTRNLKASQLLYTSPYELVNSARDKPYFQRLINIFQIQTTVSQ
nr:uncharacterized protein LOC123750613 [Procambarus clarkii]